MRRYLTYLALALVILLALLPFLEDIGFAGARRYLALLFALGGGLLVYALSGLGQRALKRLGLPHLIPGVRLLEVMGYILVLGLGLSTAGYHPTALLAGGAVAGAIMGLAAQAMLSNVLSGVALMLSGAFRVGEIVRIRSWAYGGVEYWGKVSDINLFHTVLLGPRGEVRVPNARLMDSVIVRGRELALEAMLPGEGLWRTLEDKAPNIRFEPTAVGPDGIKGILYLGREELDTVISLLQASASEAAEGQAHKENDKTTH